MAAAGIDLGNTSFVIATCKVEIILICIFVFFFSYFKMYVLFFLNQDGRPEIMTTDTGEWVTPAIVAFTDKEKVRLSLLQKSK